MTRAHIIAEIQRTARENGGKPLGTARFLNETGIKESDWLGKFWVRWGDAVIEAGFTPNQKSIALDKELLLNKYVALIRKLGHVPLEAEMRIAARNDRDFPSHNTFRRFGGKHELLAILMDYCEAHSGYEDVTSICAASTAVSSSLVDNHSDDSEENFGFVYLMKAGRYYKIGRANSIGRREYELAIQLPERASTVHVIRTDDPAGIEAYWHRRFESKRKNGEWFTLDGSDIKAFRRRKFM